MVKFTPDPTMRPFGGAFDAQAPPLPADDAPPDLFSAMEQQLALGPQKTKASGLVRLNAFPIACRICSLEER
jgi:hypothetical protein